MTNDPEFDRTPAPDYLAYRVQRTDCTWSEWRRLSDPIPEEYVLSVQISEWVTQDEYRQFMAQIKC